MPYMGLGSDLWYRIEAKIADFRMTYIDSGKLITNRAATGNLVFTLPPTADIVSGWHVWVINSAASKITVQSNTADTMTVFNDLTADSVAFGTTNEIIGGGWLFVWDGTGWLTFMFATEVQTMTVVT